MFRDINFKHEARRDSKERITWYKQQKAGLGFKFEAVLEQLLNRIRRMPELGEQVLPHVR